MPKFDDTTLHIISAKSVVSFFKNELGEEKYNQIMADLDIAEKSLDAGYKYMVVEMIMRDVEDFLD
jgi:uncharacterized protein (DUF2164 family)